MTIIELDQTQETPISSYQRGAFSVRYAYARAKDAQATNLRGEDYLVFRVEPDGLAFALCDGVGSSFFGGLAAQILGEKLLGWLMLNETRKLLSENPPEATAITVLREFLNQQVTFASQMIAQKDISGLPNQFARKAYQEKREKHGSQSNFICGLVDANAQRAWLFTLGDATIRAWQGETEYPLGLIRASEQSWSTKHGVVGDLHFRMVSLAEANILMAYSDGLNPAEKHITPQQTVAAFEADIATLSADSKSDDISFIEISVTPEMPHNPDDLVPLLRGAAPMPLLSSVLPATSITVVPKKKVSSWVIALIFFVLGGLLGVLAAGYGLPMIAQLSATATPTVTATMTPSRTFTPPQTPSATPLDTVTITSTAGVSISPTATQTVTATQTITRTVTVSPSTTATTITP